MELIDILYLPMRRYSVGVCPVSFLNNLEKFDISEKPNFTDIAFTDKELFSNSSLAVDKTLFLT